jgi:hypothetical protein
MVVARGGRGGKAARWTRRRRWHRRMVRGHGGAFTAAGWDCLSPDRHRIGRSRSTGCRASRQAAMGKDERGWSRQEEQRE